MQHWIVQQTSKVRFFESLNRRIIGANEHSKQTSVFSPFHRTKQTSFFKRRSKTEQLPPVAIPKFPFESKSIDNKPKQRKKFNHSQKKQSKFFVICPKKQERNLLRRKINDKSVIGKQDEINFKMFISTQIPSLINTNILPY